MSHLWKKVQYEMVDENTFTKKAQMFFGFPVKDIKIPDIFFKIQRFIRASWDIRKKCLSFGHCPKGGGV